MLEFPHRAAPGRQIISPTPMGPEFAELAARIPMEQIPYAIAWLSTKFWLECKQSNNPGNSASVSAVEQLLTAGQLAERLGVPESWVRSEARLGRIPSRKI